MSDSRPSLLKHIRDMAILPFTVTVIIPYCIYDPQKQLPFHSLAIVLAGIGLLIVGLLLFSYTVYLFMKHGRGTLAPWQPTQTLIVTGPYRYCRNPMISGVFFILTGESLAFHSLPLLIWAGIFFILNTLYFILLEEPSLEKRFGESYRQYKKHIPRWIPTIHPYTMDN
ncbi:methyltransferase family protein [Xanthocytophaga flava]|uniref:methyltransferase family protein n=1 Tax=Xanthocytophaga flava TaxID=3048013 RepID=UPI0028D52E4D|nr:isoprenylcysteine carboxylmethyltransferase family protein [Xanthocytophaga flavus]MDJ1471806.1 isoprenylcysteine carboxylmethyltransferase family protein [Xanthocytophaga flavus]